jgi:hypothetical protein
VTQSKTKEKGINYLANFFETHVLGLCTLFSDTLKNAQGKKTTDLEKIRCLKAIQEMLGLAAESVTSALPQVCIYCFEVMCTHLIVERYAPVPNRHWKMTLFEQLH